MVYSSLMEWTEYPQFLSSPFQFFSIGLTFLSFLVKKLFNHLLHRILPVRYKHSPAHPTTQFLLVCVFHNSKYNR